VSALETVDRRTHLSSQLLHDLRAPLNQIIGYSEMLTEDMEGPRSDSLLADLRKVGAAGHRILELLEENFTAVSDGPVSAVRARRKGESPASEPRRLSTQDRSAGWTGPALLREARKVARRG